MSDYIKREDAINAIERTWINGTSLCSADKAEEIIKSLPSADVVERSEYEEAIAVKVEEVAEHLKGQIPQIARKKMMFEYLDGFADGMRERKDND